RRVLREHERGLPRARVLADHESVPLALGERAAEELLGELEAPARDDTVEHCDRRREHRDAMAARHPATRGLERRRVARAAVPVRHDDEAVPRLRERATL